MHLYLRAIGLGGINTRKDLDKILKDIIKKSIEKDTVSYVSNEETKEYPAQIKHYFNKVSGISINGSYNPKRKSFKMEYYFPFLDGGMESYESEVSIARKTEKAAYNVLCDEPGRGIALIFQLTNHIDYLASKAIKGDYYNKAVRISAMSLDGTILLPLRKSENQIQKCRAATAVRNNLIDLAKKGDSEAIDNLAIGDIDTYTNIYKRMRKEDIFTIVDSTFMPSGFECDSYSVIGNILNVEQVENSLTTEKIYVLTLECNDIYLDVCINDKDLMGIPVNGRRFKGRIWLQGQVGFDEDKI